MPELSSGGGSVRQPGAMTMVMSANQPRALGPRWLRCALVRDGRIVWEDVRSPDRPLTIGGAGDVAVKGPERPLLLHRDGAWYLCVGPGIGGRIDAGTIEELARGVDEIELSHTAHGRIELGPVSLLIQLTDRPPVKRKPQLPASLQGGLLRGADYWFTSFVAGSFLLHFAVVTLLLQSDWPVETSLVPPRYATHIFIEPPPPEEADTLENDGSELADTGDQAPDESSTPTELADARPARPRSSDRPSPTIDPDAISHQIAENLLIAGFSPDSTGSAMVDVLRSGQPTEEATSIFDVVDGVGIATTASVGRVPVEHDGRGHSSGAGNGLAGLAGHPGRGTNMQNEGAQLTETIVVPIAHPDFGGIEHDSPAPFDSRELIRRLRPRMGAIQRCYENEINHGDPDLGGRLTLVMDVMPIGALSHVHVEDDTTGSQRLAQCAVNAVRSVRVDPGPQASVEVRYPIVFSSERRQR